MIVRRAMVSVVTHPHSLPVDMWCDDVFDIQAMERACCRCFG